MPVARLAARVAIGGLFIGHGTQKLMGWFGGPGLEGTDQMMTSLGLHPPRRNSLAAGATEAGAGAMLAAGLATPLAAAGLIGVMTTAIRTVHWSNGPWNANGGYEYNLALITALAALVEVGPGELSLDRALGTDRHGTDWALGALALGVAASLATTALGHREAGRAAAHQPGPAPTDQHTP
ncbi:DoxX family protein [Leekyejoonella antrihumi]|uniref:DoxX family protein n=1 Tax=Leekyejoonella antrihumi TaxID=1660198 RepID=A0A563DRC5_9MICO|nr:DoxX family protein [Leekyejoonella antrihumi]TWP32807.1 DoxX family protein [Leekyejoonella antrihumi]